LTGWSRRSENKDDVAVKCDLPGAIVISALHEYAEVGWSQQKNIGLCKEGDNVGSTWLSELQSASVGRRYLAAEKKDRKE
jgi:hypothetical protein